MSLSPGKTKLGRPRARPLTVSGTRRVRAAMNCGLGARDIIPAFESRKRGQGEAHRPEVRAKETFQQTSLALQACARGE